MVFMVLDFSVAPIMLGFVLGPMVEENFRRALLLSRGDMMIFLQRPISATFVGISALLLLGVIWSAWRGRKRGNPDESIAEELMQSAHVPQQQINQVTG
jgi:putative tricarboxylic transport membrane protein